MRRVSRRGVILLILFTIAMPSVFTAFPSSSSVQTFGNETTSVSSLVVPSWSVPPNIHGDGTVDLKVFYSQPFNSTAYAVKLFIKLPANVANSTGGSDVEAYFSLISQPYISYDFEVVISPLVKVNSTLTFNGSLTWLITKGEGEITEVDPITFNLTYYGEEGIEVITNQTSLHLGLNDVPIELINQGKLPIQDVCLHVNDQDVYVPRITREYTIVVPVSVSDNRSIYNLPVSVSFLSPYLVRENYTTTLSFTVMVEICSPVLAYYNFLSPDSLYLDQGMNYLKIYLENTMGTCFNSSTLLVENEGMTVDEFNVTRWAPGGVIELQLPLNISNCSYVTLDFVLDQNLTTYDIASLNIPAIHASRLSFTIVSENSSTYLEIGNRLDLNLTNVSVSFVHVNSTVNFTAIHIPAKEYVLLRLNGSIYSGMNLVVSSFYAYRFYVTEYDVVNISEAVTTLPANLSLSRYFVDTTNDQHVICLVLQFTNIGSGTATDGYVALVSNESNIYLSVV